MERKLTRRSFTKGVTAGAGGIAAAGLGAALPGFGSALGAETLTAVTWGGPWFESAKQVAEQFGEERDVAFAWELHAGGAQKIVGKVKAAWPTVQYDIIAAWDPVFHAMSKEGWLEPLDDLPNLRDIPRQYMTFDDEGRAIVAPMSVTVTCWGYRKDMIDPPVTRFEELLEPRFKGQVCMRTPTSYSGLAYVGMALEFGGDERNIDPAFDYLKELARRGNIGRVAGSDVDAINSMTTGETAFGFGVGNVWERIAEGVPIEVLMRVPGNTGFKGLPYKDGWVVLKGPKASLAKDFANYSIGPEANTAIAGALASSPTNTKATISEDARQWSYEPDELDRYTYFPDFGYLSEQVNDWSVRFEREITPLLRA